MAKNKHVEKGPGLARGPALIMGAILSAAGLILFLKVGDTPTGSFPDGTENGPSFLGFETNGWTAWFTTAAGALLLFGAAQHLLAKTMSLIVGLALGACSVIALVDGDDVLGLAAANGLTKLGWGIAAAVLLVNTLMPRIKKKQTDPDHDARRTERRVEAQPATPKRTERVEHEPAQPVPSRPVETTARRSERVETHPVDSTPVPGTRRIEHDANDPRDEVPATGGSVDPRRSGGSIDPGDERTRGR